MGKSSRALVFGRKKGDIHALHRLKLFEEQQEKRLKKAAAKYEKEVGEFKKKSAERLSREREAEERKTAEAVGQAEKQAEKEAEALIEEFKREEKRLRKLLEKNKQKALEKAGKALLEA